MPVVEGGLWKYTNTNNTTTSTSRELSETVFLTTGIGDMCPPHFPVDPQPARVENSNSVSEIVLRNAHAIGKSRRVYVYITVHLLLLLLLLLLLYTLADNLKNNVYKYIIYNDVFLVWRVIHLYTLIHL